MRVLPTTALTALFLVTMPSISTASGAPQDVSHAHVVHQFVGAWRLAWLEERGVDGKVHRSDCSGLLVYTGDGHMSVQVMYKEPQAGTGMATVQYAQGGYEASFGTYEIDERRHRFTFHVDGALVRTLVGKKLTRAYDFSGKQLIVKSSNPDENWKVAWERY